MLNHADVSPEQVEKLIDSIDWKFIADFAKTWKANICPWGKHPINLPTKVFIERDCREVLLSKRYEYIYVDIDKELPSSDEIITRVEPCDLEPRYKQLTLLFAPFSAAVYKDDGELLQKWLDTIQVHEAVTTIEYPSLKKTFEDPFSYQVGSRSLYRVLYKQSVPNILKCFLANGLDPSATSVKNGITTSLLFDMVVNDKPAHVEILLAHGAKDDNMEDVVKQALIDAKPEMLKVLLNNIELPETIPHEWNEHIYFLLLTTDAESVRCVQLLKQHGLLDKPTRQGEHEGHNQLDIAFHDKDLPGFCRLMMLGQPTTHLRVKVQDLNFNQDDEDDNSLIAYAQNPQLLNAFKHGLVEPITQWHHSSKFYPQIRIPIGVGINDSEKLSSYVVDAYSINLLAYAFQSEHLELASYILENYDDESLMALFNDDDFPPFLAVLYTRELSSLLKIMDKVVEFYGDDETRLIEVFNDMLVRAISVMNIEAYYIILNRINKLKIVLTPDDNHNILYLESEELEFFNRKFQATLDSPALKQVQSCWWDMAGRDLVILALRQGRLDIINYLKTKPWFQLDEIVPLNTSQNRPCYLDIVGDISVDAFAYLLELGLNPKAAINIDSPSKTSTIIQEIFRHDREDLLAYILEHYDIWDERFNVKKNENPIPIKSQSLAGKLMIEHGRGLCDIQNSCFMKGQKKCFKLMFEKGLIPSKTPVDRFCTLSGVIISGQLKNLQYVTKAFNLNKRSTLTLGKETWPIMRIAIYSQATNEMLSHLVSIGCSVKDVYMEGKKVKASILVECMNIFTSALVENNRPQFVRGFHALKFILKQGPYSSDCIHKALVICSKFLKTHPNEVWEATKLLAKHAVKHDLTLPSHYVVSGVRGDRDNWEEIKDHLDLLKAKARPVQTQQRVILNPKKVKSKKRQTQPKASKGKTPLPKTQPIPVVDAKSSHQAAKRPLMPLVRIDNAGIYNSMFVVKQLKGIEKISKDELDLKLDDLTQAISRLNIQVSSLTSTMAEKNKLATQNANYIKQISKDIARIETAIQGFSFDKEHVIAYGRTDSLEKLQMQFEKLMALTEQSTQLSDLRTYNYSLYELSQKCKDTLSAIHIEKRDYTNSIDTKIITFKAQLVENERLMSDRRRHFQATCPDAKKDLGHAYFERIAQIKGRFLELKKIDLSIPNQWHALCQKLNVSKLDALHLELEHILAEWTTLFDEMTATIKANQASTYVFQFSKKPLASKTTPENQFVPSAEPNYLSISLPKACSKVPVSRLGTYVPRGAKRAPLAQNIAKGPVKDAGHEFEQLKDAILKAQSDNDATYLLRNCLSKSFLELALLPGYNKFRELRFQVTSAKEPWAKYRCVAIAEELSRLKRIDVSDLSDCFKGLTI